jgi:hypothetical protein
MLINRREGGNGEARASGGACRSGVVLPQDGCGGPAGAHPNFTHRVRVGVRGETRRGEATAPANVQAAAVGHRPPYR